MIVCTSEEAATKYCCMMPKKCHGAQCMAWEGMGDNGFCGALPKSEIMQKAVESFGGVPNYEQHPFSPGAQTSAILEALTVATVQTGTIEHGMIISEHQPTNAMPEQDQSLVLPLENSQSNQSQTIHKPKHKGAR